MNTEPFQISEDIKILPTGRNVRKNCLITSLEIVNKLGITYQTLCHYTNIGLLNVAERQNNKRLYDKEEVAWRLEKIKELRAKDYSLKSIRNELETGKI